MLSRTALSSRSTRATLAALALALALGALALGVAAQARPSIAAARPQAPAPYAQGEVVVAFRRGSSRAATRPALARTGIERFSTPLAPFTTVALRHGLSVPRALARLRGKHAVAWAVPDYIAHAALADVPATSPYIPNDPGTSGKRAGWLQLQWNFACPFGVDAPG